MCGIAGFVDVGGSANPNEVRAGTAHASADVRRHPPPRSGRRGHVCRRAGAALGMRRLSIIDLGGGHQPIHNEDGRVWVVFNGEIYNYRELRARARSRGHAFYTQHRHRSPSFTPTRSGARTRSRSCAACSASRSGIARQRRCSSSAIASASSRCTTPQHGDRPVLRLGDQVAAG